MRKVSPFFEAVQFAIVIARIRATFTSSSADDADPTPPQSTLPRPSLHYADYLLDAFILSLGLRIVSGMHIFRLPHGNNNPILGEWPLAGRNASSVFVGVTRARSVP